MAMSAPGKLSRREKEVMGYMSTGFTPARAARAMYVSKRTVDFHLDRVYKKLGVHRLVDAIIVCRNAGLL